MAARRTRTRLPSSTAARRRGGAAVEATVRKAPDEAELARALRRRERSALDLIADTFAIDGVRVRRGIAVEGPAECARKQELAVIAGRIVGAAHDVAPPELREHIPMQLRRAEIGAPEPSIIRRTPRRARGQSRACAPSFQRLATRPREGTGVQAGRARRQERRQVRRWRHRHPPPSARLCSRRP